MNGDTAQIHLRVQRFLFSAGLYTPNEISFAEATWLFVDHFGSEGYCPHCKNISFFNRRRGTKGTSSIQALLDTQEFCLFELVCKRDVKHSIVYLFYLSKGRIQKVGQFPSPKEISNAVLWRLRLQRNIISSLRFTKKRIQQIGPAIGEAVVSARSRLAGLENSRRVWAARQSFAGTGMAVTLIAAVSVLTLYEEARRETVLKQQIQDAIQHADVRSDAVKAAMPSEPQSADKFDAFRGAVEAAQHSQNDVLVAIIDAGLDQPPAISAGSDLRGPQPAAASRPDQKSSTLAPLPRQSVDLVPVASTQVAQQPASQPSDVSAPADRQSAGPPPDAFTQVDQPPRGQPSDTFTQVDQQTSGQQWEDSARVDQQPAIQPTDASAQVKQKSDIASQQSDAAAPEDADPAKPNTLHNEPKVSKPRVPHLGIGVASLTSGIGEVIGLPRKHGLIITAVDPGSPAEKAGVQARDLLLKVAGKPVSRPDQVREALLSLKGKHTLILTLKREGKIEHRKLNVG
jgi:hypothetical protein